jgi:myo-inositol catabolism protein IolC
VWDIKEDSEYIVDADLLMGFENGAPIFTNGSPQWLVEMMNKELYKDILDQIYGQDIYA